MQRSWNGSILVYVIAGLVSLMSVATVFAGQQESWHDHGPAMEKHQLQLVLNRGLDIFIGANLSMLAQMQMSPGLDKKVKRRGRSMLIQGKQDLKQLLASPGMRKMRRQQGGSGDFGMDMQYVEDLATAIVQVADNLDGVQMMENTHDTTTLQYFNILIDQALEMAMKGGSMIIANHGHMAEPNDKAETIERGRAMLADARMMLIEIMGSKSMSAMHSRESGKMPAMGLTHKLTGDALRILDLLDRLE